MPTATESFAANVARFTGFADVYDQHRPPPPVILASLVAAHIGTARPKVVVDLGSGTGLSTRYWAAHAERVIGIEPAADMRRVAASVTRAANVSFVEGFSHATGLPDGSAQIVSCVQSLHWMEPAETFAEAARILEPGGIFVACDYDWPPATGSWEVAAAWNACAARGRTLEKEKNISIGLRQWDKTGHLARMQASGCFRYVAENVVHHIEPGNAQRLVGLLVSQGYMSKLLQAGVSERELGLEVVRATAEQHLGTVPRDWIWSARVRVGVK